MLDLFIFLWGSVLAPLVVNAVSYVLQKLLDQWLDNGHSHRRKKHKQNSRKYRKRR
ncbi:hypothetical protein [Lactobacillus crispatus]|uniref:hypothetical protein n=1 Tax=Lactobacillus crispatus TaxID=47770 RepID=UPI0015E0D86E|nr:hypothetical protein [Lactobacillus crispatus]